MSDLPWIVKEFLLKLTVNPDCYTFVVMTSNNGKETVIKEQKTNFTSDGSLPKEDFVTASYFYGGHSCAACYACLHWCPKNATLLKVPFLKHRPQYHHPDVTLAEIKE